jgi:hypothetical protein
LDSAVDTEILPCYSLQVIEFIGRGSHTRGVEILEATKALLSDDVLVETVLTTVILDLMRVQIRERRGKGMGWKVTDLLTNRTSPGEVEKIRDMTEGVRAETLQTLIVDTPLWDMTEEAFANEEFQRHGRVDIYFCQVLILL